MNKYLFAGFGSLLMTALLFSSLLAFFSKQAIDASHVAVTTSVSVTA
jgi:hypothetical protein